MSSFEHILIITTTPVGTRLTGVYRQRFTPRFTALAHTLYNDLQLQMKKFIVRVVFTYFDYSVNRLKSLPTEHFVQKSHSNIRILFNNIPSEFKWFINSSIYLKLWIL